MEKKHKIRAYIFLAIFVILVVSFGAYRVMSVNKEGDKKEIGEKVATEKKYIDKRLTEIFNQMNNIKYESYKISINTVKPSTQEETNQQNSKNSEGENQNIVSKDYITINAPLDYKEYGSMYAGSNGNKKGKWYLASPSCFFRLAMCTINGNTANLESGLYNNRNTISICPIVSLKSGISVEIEN